MKRLWLRLDQGELLQIALLLGALLSVAWGIIQAAPRGPDMSLIMPFILLAALGGSALAHTRMRTRTAVLWLLLGGLILVVLRVGALSGTVWRLTSLLYRLAATPGAAALSLYPEAPDPLLLAWTTLADRVGVFIARVSEWLLTLFMRRTSFFDPVAAAAVWALGLWMVSAWGGFVMARYRRPLTALLPATALLATLFAYTGRPPYVLLPVLGLTLLLLALSSHRERETHWRAVGLDFSHDIRVDLGFSALLLTAGLVLLAAIVPALSLQNLSEFTRRLTQGRTQRSEQVAESLGVAQRTPGAGSGGATTFELLGQATLPQQHLIGSSPELSQQVALVIRTGELPPRPESELLTTPPRHYWRSVIYSRYTGWGWSAIGAQINSYEAGQPAPLPQQLTQRRVRQEVEVVGDTSGRLFVTGQLVAVDQPYALAWFPPDEIFAGTLAAESYRADSLIPVATAQQLRSVPAQYPDWVVAQYLQLPETVPTRVRRLARELTATEPTPYDRALAIERHLRTYPYTLDVPPPQREVDIADYFLFELQKGYCDYYATAMVVLARAAGLPARMVVGYAPGTYDALNARYVVTEADAHAWVEIYFNAYGWIEFEPTTAQDTFERALTDLAPEWPDADAVLPGDEAVWVPGSWVWPWLYGPALLLLLLVGLVVVVDEVWLRLLAPALAVSQLHRRVRRHALRLAVTLTPGDTPFEIAAAYAQRWEALSGGAGWVRGALAATPELLHRLMTCYAQVWYMPDPPLLAARAEAVALWRALRWRLWFAWLWQRVRRKR